MTSRADFLADVLAHIEGHPFEPLSVADLAAVAGLSPYHFSRAFTARLGVSVMAHVRTRRLEAAYLRLAGSSPPPLITLALDCGFESQEAFTRAFRARYGVAPGQFRRAASQSETLRSPSMNGHARVTRIDNVSLDGFVAAGPSAAFDNDTKHGIPALWPRLVRCLPLKDQIGRNTYGVCWAADPQTGAFSYMAAVAVGTEADLPAGFQRLDLQPQTYAVFRIALQPGDLHQQIQAAMRTLWGEMMPAAGLKIAPAPDLEVYPEDFNPERAGMHVDFYVPIEA